MRYHHLHVENFGIHRDWPIPLAGDVQLIYGPNEAGKTTLLQLLREILFRIHPQTPYLQCSGNGPLAARVEFELSDGRRGWFRRQKGNPDQIIGELADGSPLGGQTVLDQLSGGASASLYQNIFAFSAEELRAGADSLRAADLGDALFGGGIGGLGVFQQVQATLQKRMEALFKPGKVAAKPRINAVLAELRAAQEQFQQAQCRPQAYDDWEERRQAHAEKISRLDEQMEELRRRGELLRRQKQALQAWVQRRGAMEERRRIDVPAGITRELAAEFHALDNERELLTQKLRELEEKRLRRRPVAPLTAAESALLAAEEEISSLQPQLSQMLAWSGELPQLRSSRDTLEQELARFRRERPGRELSVVTREQQAAARRLAEELPSLEERTRSLKQQREKLDARLTRQRRKLNALPASRSVEEWERLAKGAAVWQTQAREQRDQAARLAEVQYEIDNLLRDLGSVVGPEVDLTQPLPLPLRTTIETFRTRWERQAQAEAEAERRLHDACEELYRARKELAQCEAIGPGDDTDHVAARRAHRDRGWRLIQRLCWGGDSSAAEAPLAAEIDAWTEHRPDQLPALYEAAVTAADQAADRALERAAWETQRQQRLREVEVRAARCTELEAALADVRQAGGELRKEWQTLWSPAGIRPRSPAEMLEWLQKREALDVQRGKSAGLQQALAAIEQERGAFAQQLARVWPELPLTPIEAVVPAVEERAREVRRVEEDRSRLLAEIDDLATDDEDLKQQEAQVHTDLADWHARLTALLIELKLPTEWRLDQLAAELACLQRAAEVQEQLDEVARRLHEGERRWSDYEQEVQRVWRSAASGPCPRDPVAAAEELARRLKSARDRREEINRDAAEAAADEGVRRHTAGLLQQCEERLAVLCERLGFSSAAALKVGVERFETADRLDQQIHQAERDLGNILWDDWESHAEELDTTTAEELTEKLDRLNNELDQLRAAHAREVAEQGKLAARLRALAEETDVLSRAADLEAKRAELVAAVHEWAPLALTQVLLRRAVRRFQEERQPEMLGEVADLLRRITGGEHVAIRRSFESEHDGDPLLVEDRRGQPRTAEQLSMGARAQLYLAIRLAFVVDYCRRNEPLPVVMDDVLVHFDDHRARRTLEVLAEFSQHAQVLLLTCHRRTVELWREVRPQAPILDLSRPEGDHEGTAGRRPAGRRKRTARAEASRLFPPPER